MKRILNKEYEKKGIQKKIINIKSKQKKGKKKKTTIEYVKQLVDILFKQYTILSRNNFTICRHNEFRSHRHFDIANTMQYTQLRAIMLKIFLRQ